MPDNESTAPAPDRTASTDCVNRLVRRTGCTIREAQLTLAGKTLDEQREISTTGRASMELGRNERLGAALEMLRKHGVDPTSPCPFGAAAKRGPNGKVLEENGRRVAVKQTWGDAVARLVFEGRAANVAELLRRAG